MGTCVGVRSGGPTSGAHASCPPPWQQGLQLRGERSGCGQYVRTKYKTTSKFWNSINTVNTHLNDTCIVLSLATSFFLSVSISNMSINWPSRAIDLWFGTIPDLLNTPHNRQSWCSQYKRCFHIYPICRCIDHFVPSTCGLERSPTYQTSATFTGRLRTIDNHGVPTLKRCFH